jgi:hypothetical protein
MAMLFECSLRITARRRSIGADTKFSTKFSTVELTGTKLAHKTRAAVARGIS